MQGVLRRQAEFASAAAAFERYRAAPAFARLVRIRAARLHHGTASRICRMAGCGCCAARRSKSAILRPIFEAMEQVYRGDDRGNPFGWLSRIDCPVRIATAENPGRSTRRWRRGPPG